MIYETESCLSSQLFPLIIFLKCINLYSLNRALVITVEVLHYTIVQVYTLTGDSLIVRNKYKFSYCFFV